MTWKNILKENIKQVPQLKSYVSFSKEEENVIEKIANVFPISSTQYYLSLINPEDPDDPIRKMVIPTMSECDLDGEFDTSGEAENTVVQGVQHKYKRTALILSTNKCAMYCRHCFRKRLVGVKTSETLNFIENAMGYVGSHEEINNVLISGGDSFLLDNALIKNYLESLTEMPHIDFIRFGTRTPVVFPERIYADEELLSILKTFGQKKQIYVVTQFNHPNELTEQAVKAVHRLREAGIVVNNQTVLLKGVNDQPDTLAKLQNNLVRHGIVPYYIFQCRPVKGVKNQFQVPLKKAVEIVEEAKKSMSGLAKRIKFCMSHRTGKIEILGVVEDQLLLKYHQAKAVDECGMLVFKDIEDDAKWI